ncbi:MAG: CoA transferase [Coprococcus sp.]
MERLPLKGITIVDFGHVMAGPYGTKQLLSLGATVIKVEAARHADNFRHGYTRPGVKNSLQEAGWVYQENNLSKMSLNINIKSAKAQKILHELVKKADVVTANLSPGGFHKMGIDYEMLSKIKEDIIVLNASGMGDYGLYSEYKTAAPIMQALSGFSSLIGYDGEAPYGISAALADYAGGVFIAASIVSALEYRRRTGKGQFIDLSSTEANVAVIGSAFMDYSAAGVETVPFEIATTLIRWLLMVVIRVPAMTAGV